MGQKGLPTSAFCSGVLGGLPLPRPGTFTFRGWILGRPRPVYGGSVLGGDGDGGIVSGDGSSGIGLLPGKCEPTRISPRIVNFGESGFIVRVFCTIVSTPAMELV